MALSKMRSRWIEIFIIVIALGLLSFCFAAWDNTKPADSDAIYTWDNSIRDNWDALEAIFGVDLVGGSGRLNLEGYGGDPTGAADSQSAFTDAIADASSDGIIYIPEGTFLLSSAVTINKSLTIIGNGKSSIIKVGFADYAFIVSAGTNLVLQDFVLDGDSTGTGFSITANLELLIVERVTFHDCATNYCINANSTIDIDRVEIIGCTMKDCLSGMRFAGECVSAYVGHNLVDTLTGTSAVIGFQLGHNTAAMQDVQQRYIVEDNVFLDITTTGVDDEAHAVLLYGRDTIIKNNIINTITNHATSTQGAEAIYTKAKFITVSSNIIVDGGTSNNGIIAVKGVERGDVGVNSYAIIITDNMLIESAVTADIGIWLGGDDILCEGNYFENLSGNAIRTQLEELDNIHILNNVIVSHQGSKAIRTSHQGIGLRINGNFIWDMTSMGISVESQVGFLEDVEINNNYISGTSADASTRRGIYIVALDAPGRFKGLQIIGNHIPLIHTAEDVFGIYIAMTVADDVAIAQFVMRDNDCSRLAGHDAAGTLPMYFSGTSELKISDFIVRDNFFWGPYQDKAAGFNVEFEHSGDLFTNNGAGGVITGVLPDAQPGLIFSFAAVDDHDLRVDPDGADTIIGGSGGGNYMSLDTLGDTATFECVIADEWIIKTAYGTLASE